jgi:hypothetical protein
MHNMGLHRAPASEGGREKKHSCVSNPFLGRRISTSQVRTRVISFAQTFSANGCVPDMALRLVDVLFENVLGEKMAPRVPVKEEHACVCMWAFARFQTLCHVIIAHESAAIIT